METEYTTRGGVRVRCDAAPLPYPYDLTPLAAALDDRRGLLLASSCDVPGRYARYDLGFVDPPLAFAARGRTLDVEALSARGAVLLPAVAAALRGERALERLEEGAGRLRAAVRAPAGTFTEEERTRQPSIFSLLRAVLAHFASDADPHLGLYGAFGYDLVFAFEPIAAPPAARRGPARPRALPARRARRRRPPQGVRGAAPLRLRGGRRDDRGPRRASPPRERARAAAPREPRARADHGPGEYAAVVESATERFRAGDLFEVVPGQTFSCRARAQPSALFERCAAQPRPYGFLASLGAASTSSAPRPRCTCACEAGRVETCPIAGTIRARRRRAERRRAASASSSLAQGRGRADDVHRRRPQRQVRVCEPGSVRVHRRAARSSSTAPHPHRRPRRRAARARLRRARRVPLARLGGDGDGRAEARGARVHRGAREERAALVRRRRRLARLRRQRSTPASRSARCASRTASPRCASGATLLSDSVPEEEERETRLKAAALFRTLELARGGAVRGRSPSRTRGIGHGTTLLFVDCEDSFVHTLASYFRATGAEV